MQASIEDKQKYLFNEIIQKNFDPQAFQDFMATEKQQVELDQWTMAQLEKVVTKFQNQDKKGSEQEKGEEKQEEGYENEPHRKSILFEESPSETVAESSQYLEFSYESKYELFSQNIDCKSAKPNTLFQKETRVRIQKFQKKQGGTFEQSYVNYVVATPCISTRVNRRYSDFEWLKKTLEVLYPGHSIPPIAKKGQFRRYDDKHLNKRRLILEMFINKLLSIPEIKASQLIEDFLKTTDKAGFQRIKAHYKKITAAPIPLQKLETMKGKVNLVLDPKINSFLVKVQNYLNDVQPSAKKLYKDFKMAASALENCSAVLQNISKSCKVLNDKDYKFKKLAQLNYCPMNHFTILDEMTEKLSIELQKQALIFREDMYGMLKYESLLMLNTLQSFDKVADLQQKYNSARANLIKKKIRLYEQGAMVKWGLNEIPKAKPTKNEAMKIMLPKQSTELAKFRQTYAFHNFELYEEMNREFITKNVYLADHLAGISKYETKIASELMMIWADIQINLMGMKENKEIRTAQLINSQTT